MPKSACLLGESSRNGYFTAVNLFAAGGFKSHRKMFVIIGSYVILQYSISWHEEKTCHETAKHVLRQDSGYGAGLKYAPQYPSFRVLPF